MAQRLQAVRGMNDVLPAGVSRWQFIERTTASVLEQYGYQQVRLPIMEFTELFCRSIGEVTDIVEKEMYTFQDRDKHSLSLRPEGTAGVVRAGNQHGLFYNQVQRLWYAGPMFRHERPQRGRLRQFHQIGVEAFGMSEPDIDAELIMLTARLWRELGIQSVRLELNSLGTPEARAVYRQALVEYLQAHHDVLDDDSKRRLESNPLRVLDSKNPAMQALIADAPSLADYLDDESAAHFADLCERLTAAGIEFTVNPRLVRGLDYYSRTVFEWITDKLGAQGAVCAGGRYDALVEQLGGKPAPAIGFAMGMERLVELLVEDQANVPEAAPQLYFVAVGVPARKLAQQLAEQIRSAGLSVLLNADSNSLKAQMKRADKSGAKWALVLGDNELAADQVTVKPLRGGEQQQVGLDSVLTHLQQLLSAEQVGNVLIG